MEYEEKILLRVTDLYVVPYHYLSAKVNSILFIPTASFFGSFEQLLEPTMSQSTNYYV